MIVFLGILLWTAVNAWLTLYAFLATVPTFGDNTLMNGGFWMISSIDIKVVV